ncbi:MAG: hypothetical protein Q8P18_18345 [Pseudomonadota bacterium]|nr:hypothetical protein [Pseudomonadota bacterium]
MSTAVSRLASQPRYRKSPAIYKGFVLWNSATESDVPSAKTLSWDTGAPNHTAAQGSVYIRLDSSTAATALYRNTNGAGTWEPVVGAAPSVAAAAVYASIEQTGTGSEQIFAHGLGSTPAFYLAYPTAGHDGAGAAGTQMPVIAHGVMSATELRFTVSTGAKFRVLAVK